MALFGDQWNFADIGYGSVLLNSHFYRIGRRPKDLWHAFLMVNIDELRRPVRSYGQSNCFNDANICESNKLTLAYLILCVWCSSKQTIYVLNLAKYSVFTKSKMATTSHFVRIPIT